MAMHVFTDLELMSIHVRALFTCNPDSRLLFINEPGIATASAPRLFLGRTRTGNIWRFRADLSESLRQELDLLCADEPPVSTVFNEMARQAEMYKRLLEKHAPIKSVSNGPAYYFSEDIGPSRQPVDVTEKDAMSLRLGFEELIEELADWQPFVALIVDVHAVSVCRSVRITPEAHEAGVDTLPDFRGRGYAVDVAAAWASRVRARGAIPLHSTSWENDASQAVARKLHLVCYGADFSVG